MLHSRVWTIVLAVAGIYLVGFLIFVSSLPKTPARTMHADGIVALTGGDTRLDAAESLLEDGDGKRLLISGVHAAITKDQVKHLVHGGRRFDCCADLGFSALSTHGNAAEAAGWARAHGYRSLLVVTANYHMPRSLREFSSQMPDMRLLPYPVEEEDVDVERWWSNPHTARVLHTEYAKYLGSLLFTAMASTQHRENSREARNE